MAQRCNSVGFGEKLRHSERGNSQVINFPIAEALIPHS